jgi:poly(3-hydroxybutyrate) depolymerase
MTETVQQTRPKTDGLLWGQRLMTVLLSAGLCVVLVQILFKPELPQAVAALKVVPGDCSSGLSGTPGRHAELYTHSGLRFSVIAPSNYSVQNKYGLMMVFPPAGFSEESAERYYQLTARANAQGYVVVYSAAIPLSARALRMQHEVVPQVMATWCIDRSRIVFAGHSDGGSVTAGLTVRETDLTLQPTHVVISAAGITAEDFEQEKCPAPLNVTLLHNPDDELFPAYGQGAAKWWAQCMQCKADVINEASGCLLRQCAGQKLLRYCATSEPHAKWPSVTAHMFAWLD